MLPFRCQTRREFLHTAGATAAFAGLALSRASGSSVRQRRPLGFSTYGMKTVPILDAVDRCARIGYDTLELSVRKDFPTAATKLSSAMCRAIRDRVRSAGLSVSSLLVGINAGRPEEQAEILGTIIPAAGEVARALDDHNPPILATVLGGKAEEWESGREELASRLHAWAEAAQAAGVSIAVKAHYGHAINSPERMLWLYRRVNHPRLAVSYDYSHYQAEGFELEPSLRALRPHVRHVHVKDIVPGKKPPEYLLPGEGAVDYVAYFRLLDELNYPGAVVVEVSAHLHNQSGYDPFATAEKCFAGLSKARRAAGRA